MIRRLDTLNLEIDEKIKCVQQPSKSWKCERYEGREPVRFFDSDDESNEPSFFDVVVAGKHATMTAGEPRGITIEGTGDTYDCVVSLKSGIGKDPRKELKVLDCGLED
jgi:hypothetical protein